MTIDIICHSEPTKWVKNLFQYASNKIPKQVRNDKQITVTLNCLGFCFTKKILRYAQYDDKYSSSFWTHEVGEESVCEAMASECELALRRSRPLFFLVGVHVILSFLVGKKRKNNGYEKRKTSDMLKSLVERCWNKFGMTNKMLSPWIYFRVYINRYFG